MEEKLKKWIDFFDQAGIKDSTNIRKFAQKFDDEKIDDDIIQTLTEQDLKDFGVDAKGDRLRILKRIGETNKIELAADPAISENLKHTTHTPPKSSPGNTPPKKNSKTDEFKEKVKACKSINEIVVEATAIIAHLEEKNEIEKQNFNEVESPMYFRSAIEILEAAYIPDEKVRESMTRYSRWQNILTKNCNSIELLKNEIKKKNCALTVDNFPEYIVQAYKFANPPIHHYFLKKYRLNSDTLERVYNAYNFHFGAELVVKCLKAEGSPPKKFAPPSRSRSHRRKSRSYRQKSRSHRRKSRSYRQKSRSHRRESSSRSRHINNRSRSSSYRSRNSK